MSAVIFEIKKGDDTLTIYRLGKDSYYVYVGDEATTDADIRLGMEDLLAISKAIQEYFNDSE